MSLLQPLVWSNRNKAKTPFRSYHVKVINNEICVSYGSKDGLPAKGFATVDDAKHWAEHLHYRAEMLTYLQPDSVRQIESWFKAAKPEPTAKDICTQIGCHFEEVAENLEAINGNSDDLHDDANDLKSAGNTLPQADIDQFVSLIKPLELLDSLCDQIVTAIGVGYMMGFDMQGALAEVIRSNNSKMVNGKFEFDENGKIKKPKSFSEPNLKLFLGVGNGKA